MKDQENLTGLRFALAKANAIRKIIGGAFFDLKRIRTEWSPKQNLRAFRNLHGPRRTFDFANDINSGTHVDGIISKLSDAAILRYLLVQKGASLATNVAVFTTGTPIGITIDDSAAITTLPPVAVRLLTCGIGTVIAKSSGSAAIAYGDELIGVTGGTVITVTAGAGTYKCVGISLEPVANGADGTASQNGEFEMSPGFWYNTH